MPTTDEITEVRQLRNAAGMTQEEAAEACGIPYTTFAAYDRGDRQPSADRMDTIRDVLGRRENPSGRDGYVQGRATGSAPRAPAGLYDVPELERKAELEGWDPWVAPFLYGGVLHAFNNPGRCVYCLSRGGVTEARTSSPPAGTRPALFRQAM